MAASNAVGTTRVGRAWVAEICSIEADGASLVMANSAIEAVAVEAEVGKAILV